MIPLHKSLVKFTRSNECVVLCVFIAVAFLFGFINPAFFTVRNFYDLLQSIGVNGIFACGVMLVIINGGIDLSFMAISICAAYITTRGLIAIGFDGPIIVMFAMSGVIGMLFGLCNSFLISKFKIPIFIVTISIANVIRGLVMAFVGNEYVPSSRMPSCTVEFSGRFWFNAVDASGSQYGLHFSVFITLGIMLFTAFILRYTLIGRGVYALGGDAVSAECIGYNLKKLRHFIYGYAGMLAGIAGIIYVSNNRMADPVSFQGEELTVIAAVVMGGVKITGGKGTMFGVLLGLLLTQMINNNLVLIKVPSYWQRFTFGCLVIVAVVFQALRERKQAKL